MSGAREAWRSLLLSVVVVTVLLGWLSWPLLHASSAPDAAQVREHAPWVLGFTVCALAALAVAIWRDSGRRPEILGAALAMIALDTIVRLLMTPPIAGVEFVHALPLLAGVIWGAPVGFFVGASACVVSTVLVAVPAETLPTQALIWGLFGLVGALLSRAPVLVAWLGAALLALPLGVATGMLLNLMGWPYEAGTSTLHYSPGMPLGDAFQRLWNYSAHTSFGVDVTRGVTTGAVVLLFGLPVLRALRAPREVSTPAVANRRALSSTARVRRERSDLLHIECEDQK